MSCWISWSAICRDLQSRVYTVGSSVGLASMTGQYPTQHSRGASLSCSFMLKLVQAGTTCGISSTYRKRVSSNDCLQSIQPKSMTHAYGLPCGVVCVRMLTSMSRGLGPCRRPEWKGRTSVETPVTERRLLRGWLFIIAE